MDIEDDDVDSNDNDVYNHTDEVRSDDDEVYNHDDDNNVDWMTRGQQWWGLKTRRAPSLLYVLFLFFSFVFYFTNLNNILQVAYAMGWPQQQQGQRRQQH